MTGDTISVVICAYDMARWDDLREAVDSVLWQTEPAFELLLVIDHNPGLFERARAEITGAEVIESTGPSGLSGARNTGLWTARGSIVAFLDDDAVAEPEWLERLGRTLEEERVVAVGGGTRPIFTAGRPPWFPDEFDWVIGTSYRGLPRRRSEVRNVFGGNMAVRRTRAIAIGGFDHALGRVPTRLTGGEETALCIELKQADPGAAIVYDPEAVIGHKVCQGRCRLSYFLSRCFHEGRSKSVLSEQVGRQRALSSEWRYSVQVLPLGVLRNIWDCVRRFDPSGLQRAFVIVAGFTWTATGFVTGVLARPFRTSG